MPLDGRRPLAAPGDRYGRLTTIEPGPRKPSGAKTWLCRCDCGTQKTVIEAMLRCGHTKSCGCLQRERAAAHNRANTRHGATVGGGQPRLYRMWHNMLMRCRRPAATAYPNYGGRGITVCDAWSDFSTFRTWAEANGYRQGLQIDRIDNDGPYSPENCRWVTSRENCNNRRNTRRIEVDGQTFTLANAARAFGVGYFLLISRINRGWSPEKAIATPPCRGSTHGH